MKRRRVESTCVRGYGYDENKRVFEIEYPSGEVYDYMAVPPSVYRAFVRANSKGEFVNFKIKRFPFRKVSG